MTPPTDRDDQIDHEAMRLSAPAPGDVEPPESAEDQEFDDLCERWVEWCRTRTFYRQPDSQQSLGDLAGSSGGARRRSDGPDAPISAELAAFHLAFLGQPPSLGRKVFELYYVRKVRPVKAAAARLGISRRHFYGVLTVFRGQVRIASKAILAENIAAREALPHRAASPGDEA